MWSSHAISLFCQVYFWCFPSPLCQIVRWDCRILTLSVCIHNLPIPQFYFSMLPNCQVHSTLWTAQMSFKLPTKLLKISGLSEVWMFFLICFCWAPENHIAPVISVFFHRLPRAPPSFLPPLSLPCFSFIFDLMNLWSSRGALSKLKFTPQIIFENNDIPNKLIRFDFKFHVFFFFKSPFLWVMCTWIYPNGIFEAFAHC